MVVITMGIVRVVRVVRVLPKLRCYCWWCMVYGGGRQYLSLPVMRPTIVSMALITWAVSVRDRVRDKSKG